MSQLVVPQATDWTAVDLVRRFEPIPLHRVRHDPAPRTATEGDVVRIHDLEDRLYELVEQALDGGDVLPGLTLSLPELFSGRRA